MTSPARIASGALDLDTLRRAAVREHLTEVLDPAALEAAYTTQELTVVPWSDHVALHTPDCHYSWGARVRHSSVVDVLAAQGSEIRTHDCVPGIRDIWDAYFRGLHYGGFAATEVVAELDLLHDALTSLQSTRRIPRVMALLDVLGRPGTRTRRSSSSTRRWRTPFASCSRH